MVVHAGSSAAFALVGGGEPTNIAPIVITPEQRHIVRHTHAPLVIFLHFFVERPVLGYFGKRLLEVPSENRPLVGNDLLKERDVCAIRHRHVAVAAHAQSDDALVVLITLDALFPKFAQLFAVTRVVPRAGTMPL